MPEISVIFPVYNESEENLRLSLGSLFNQTYRDFEIIVIDDSTLEESRGVIDRLALQDSRIRVLRPERREGLPSALNFGISESRGQLIARADSDDIQEPGRLFSQVSFLQANPRVSIVGTSIIKIDSSGNEKGYRQYPASHEAIHRASCIKNPICHPTVMIRKEVFDRCGVYDPSFKRAEDYELWLRLLKQGVKFANLSEPLVRYRLADTTKRDSDNWKFNLDAKRKNFSSTYLFSRLIGIAVVGGYHSMPVWLRERLYQLYNRV